MENIHTYIYVFFIIIIIYLKHNTGWLVEVHHLLDHWLKQLSVT